MKSLDSINNILGFGHLIFDISLNLSEVDPTRYNINFDQLNSLKDCEEFLKDPYILSRLQLSSTNPLINLLLFVNKCSENKMLIEFIGSSYLTLPEESKIFETIITNLTYKNNIIFIESDCCKHSGSINFIIKKSEINKDKGNKDNEDNNENSNIKAFCIYTQPKDQENEENAEKAKKADTTRVPFLATEGLTYKESKIYEKLIKRVNKFKKKSFLLSKFNYDFRCTSFFLLDLNDFLYNEYSSILEEIPNFLETIVQHYKHLKIIVNFPTGSSICQENAEIISKVLSFGDYIIFDKNDVIIPNQLQTSEYFFNKDQEVNILKDVLTYKQKGIKNGIFIEDLKRFSYLEQEIENNHSLISNFFIMNLEQSKHNYDNIKELEKDKFNTSETITNNYDLLKFCFLGAFFSKIFLLKSQFNAYNFAYEVFKKLVDLFKNGFDIPIEKNYFLPKQVRKLHRKSNTFNNFMNMKQKEDNFLLDCENTRISKLKAYNPILDKHMTSFFENQTAGKYLHNLNVINKSGFTIKNIYNKKIVDRLPIDCEDDIKKFYHGEEVKIYPEEKDIPKLKLLKVFDKLPLKLNNLNKVETTKNPTSSHNKLNLDFLTKGKKSANESINITKHIKNASSVSNINVKTGFWEKHNISIKDSPYIKDLNLMNSFNKTKLPSIDLTNYNKFLSEIESSLKLNSQFSSTSAMNSNNLIFSESSLSISNKNNKNKTSNNGGFKIKSLGKIHKRNISTM